MLGMQVKTPCCHDEPLPCPSVDNAWAPGEDVIGYPSLVAWVSDHTCPSNMYESIRPELLLNRCTVWFDFHIFASHDIFRLWYRNYPACEFWSMAASVTHSCLAKGLLRLVDGLRAVGLSVGADLAESVAEPLLQLSIGR